MNKKDLFNKPSKNATRMIPENSQGITVDRLKGLLPPKTNIAVTEEIVSLINNMEATTGLPQELMEEDVLSHLHILNTIKGVGVKDLVNAIKFCNLTRNYDNKEAWSIVFPDKYNALVEANKQIDNHVSMYNKSKLVVAISKEMLIPVSITYAPYFDAAVRELYAIGVLGKGGKNTDGKEMTVTPMVKVQALKELTSITKPPEEAKLSVTVNPSDAAMSVQESINEQLATLVAKQQRDLASGKDINEVQQIGINFDVIDAEVTE